jgi:uncharacterized Ntn-hydrolase superfamily protein
VIRSAAVLAFVLLFTPPAFATWAVVAVDVRTGTVAISSATCVPQARFANFPAKGLMDIQAIVVPGVGAAVAQATVDETRANQMLIYAELKKGTAPAEILKLLAADPRTPLRQFGIVDVQGRAAAFTGPQSPAVAIDRQGKVGEDVYFSIQGNSLAAPDVVNQAVAAFQDTSGTLTDRVMAAMEAADGKGGDRRCNCGTAVPSLDGRNPLEGVPCDAKTAHVAYLLRADKTDAPGASFNDGQYALYINVTDQDITRRENANPVKTLRLRYEVWKKAHEAGAAHVMANGAAVAQARGRNRRQQR